MTRRISISIPGALSAGLLSEVTSILFFLEAGLLPAGQVPQGPTLTQPLLHWNRRVAPDLRSGRHIAHHACLGRDARTGADLEVPGNPGLRRQHHMVFQPGTP